MKNQTIHIQLNKTKRYAKLCKADKVFYNIMDGMFIGYFLNFKILENDLKRKLKYYFISIKSDENY